MKWLAYSELLAQIGSCTGCTPCSSVAKSVSVQPIMSKTTANACSLVFPLSHNEGSHKHRSVGCCREFPTFTLCALRSFELPLSSLSFERRCLEIVSNERMSSRSRLSFCIPMVVSRLAPRRLAMKVAYSNPSVHLPAFN